MEFGLAPYLLPLGSKKNVVGNRTEDCEGRKVHPHKQQMGQRSSRCVSKGGVPASPEGQ